MKTTFRNSDVATLKQIAEHLLSNGHAVSQIVVPENQWTDGNPYFHTSASQFDVLVAYRATR